MQLQKEVLGFYANSNNYFQFESSLDYKYDRLISEIPAVLALNVRSLFRLMEVIERFSSNKPTLVVCTNRESLINQIHNFFRRQFCATRKSVTNAAERLVRQCAEMIHATGQYGPQHPWVKTRQQSESLKDIKSKLTDKKLAGMNGTVKANAQQSFFPYS